jgi:hypothetical protein
VWFVVTFVASLPALLLYDPVLNDTGYICTAMARPGLEPPGAQNKKSPPYEALSAPSWPEGHSGRSDSSVGRTPTASVRAGLRRDPTGASWPPRLGLSTSNRRPARGQETVLEPRSSLEADQPTRCAAYGPLRQLTV